MPRRDPVEGPAPARSSRRPLYWWSAAAAALLLGYTDLVRGGETIAPILLVLGYLVLIPIAILRS